MDDSVCGICGKKIEPPYTIIRWSDVYDPEGFSEDICMDCGFELSKLVSQLKERKKAIEVARLW